MTPIYVFGIKVLGSTSWMGSLCQEHLGFGLGLSRVWDGLSIYSLCWVQWAYFSSNSKILLKFLRWQKKTQNIPSNFQNRLSKKNQTHAFMHLWGTLRITLMLWENWILQTERWLLGYSVHSDCRTCSCLHKLARPSPIPLRQSSLKYYVHTKCGKYLWTFRGILLTIPHNIVMDNVMYTQTKRSIKL